MNSLVDQIRIDVANARAGEAAMLLVGEILADADGITQEALQLAGDAVVMLAQLCEDHPDRHLRGQVWAMIERLEALGETENDT